MKALIVEDDYSQADDIRAWMLETWEDMDVEVISTESRFREWLRQFQESPPNIVIIDVMLRRADPSPNAIDPPRDVATQGYYSAGLRCVELLHNHNATSSVPVILYSVLERDDLNTLDKLPPNDRFLSKTSERSSLMRVVGSFMAAQGLTSTRTLDRDVFICHAREDRDSVVSPLVTALESAGITVWQDEAEIKWGDSVVSKVEEGLQISRYVLAVLSKHSIGKPWPRRELHSALNREASSGKVKVLPLIVGTDRERNEILDACLLQNDKLYVSWTGDAGHVVERLRERLRPASP